MEKIDGKITLTENELGRLRWSERQKGARQVKQLSPEEDEILEYAFKRCADGDACRNCPYYTDGSCDKLGMKLINRVHRHETSGRTILP